MNQAPLRRRHIRAGAAARGNLTMTVTPTAAMTAGLGNRNPMATGITPTKAIAIRNIRNLDRDTSSPEAAIRRPKKDPRSNRHHSLRSAPVSGADLFLDAVVAFRQAQQNISDSAIVCFFCKAANVSDTFFMSLV